MNCQAFNQIIVEFAGAQLTDAPVRAAAEAHQQSCAACAARVARQQAIAAALGDLARQEQTLSAPAQLFAQLQTAFEQQNVRTLAAPEPHQPWLSAWFTWRLVTVGAVALVLLFFLAALRLWRPVTPAAPISNETAHTDTSAPTPVQLEPGSEKRTVSVDVPVPVTRRSRQRTKPVRRNADEYGELLSLLPLSQTEADEFEQVVRLQIPRATLRLWGLPVNEESTAEQVSAEVVFNEVGVARAIRLRNEK